MSLSTEVIKKNKLVAGSEPLDGMSIMSKRKVSAARLQEAKIAGSKVYESATECKHCASTVRYVSTRSCVKCTKAKNQERKLKELANEPCLLQFHYLHTMKKDREFRSLCANF